MIWFGIFLVIVVEMAQITPPVGFNLFVLQGMANKDMGYIARSAFPLFLLMVLAVILVVIFPEIALWMPEQMVKNFKLILRRLLQQLLLLIVHTLHNYNPFKTSNLSTSKVMPFCFYI